MIIFAVMRGFSAGKICDFEGPHGLQTDCPWKFEPAVDGFRVVGGTIPPGVKGTALLYIHISGWLTSMPFLCEVLQKVRCFVD